MIVLDSRTLEVWVEVLESCLPDEDEGYDDDTEAVLGNVIRSIKKEYNPPVQSREA